jgi:sulfite reductase beta subunit-like hemoprotein
MKFSTSLDPVLADALATVADFIRQVTGDEPTQAELADALTRYFVLNEIKDHVLMLREGIDA